MPSFITLVLLPLSWLYAGVMAVRNWLYEIDWKPRKYFSEVSVLNVGNLRVGGTGKTPHVAWLVSWLQQKGQRPALLSRGYGRRTKGYRLANTADTAATIGDEPLQQFRHFGGLVPVVVSEDRVVGIQRLLREVPTTSAVVLDDAYQHRRVQPAFNILLTEQKRPFYQDYVLPAGRLRESRTSAARADVVIVTKCHPHLSTADQKKIAQNIQRYTRAQVPVLFSCYDYGQPVALRPALGQPGPEILLLTGIANPQPLREHLEGAGYHILQHARFADHHTFQPEELQQLAAQLQPGQSVLTTQKDAARLLEPTLAATVVNLPVFYIPIEVRFLADGETQMASLLTPYFQPHAVV